MRRLTLELPDNLAEKFQAVQGKNPGEKLGTLLLHWATLGLRECNEAVLRYETKYGMIFEQFRASWDAGEIPNKHSHEVERDLMEWEGYEAERQTWLSLLRELKG